MPKRRQSFTEIGRSGLNRSAGRIYDEFLSSLRGSTGIKKYHEMRENDPIVGACMHAITQILREARWSVLPAEGGSEEDAEFLEDIIHIHDELLLRREVKVVVLDPVDDDEPEIAHHVVFS